MTDPTLTQALATPCRRCGGMPEAYHTKLLYYVVCPDCLKETTAQAYAEDAARQWVEMNKEVEDAGL